MSLRYLAQALYESMKQEEELAARLANLPPGTPVSERDALARELRLVRKETADLRRRLEAKKSES